MTDITELTAKLKATEQHAKRGWNEAHEQEACAEAAEKRIAELEARTLTVKLPPNELIVNDNTMPGDGWEVFDAQKVTDALKSACAAAGIKLQIEGE